MCFRKFAFSHLSSVETFPDILDASFVSEGGRERKKSKGLVVMSNEGSGETQCDSAIVSKKNTVQLLMRVYIQTTDSCRDRLLIKAARPVY